MLLLRIPISWAIFCIERSDSRRIRQRILLMFSKIRTLVGRPLWGRFAVPPISLNNRQTFVETYSANNFSCLHSWLVQINNSDVLIFTRHNVKTIIKINRHSQCQEPSKRKISRTFDTLYNIKAQNLFKLLSCVSLSNGEGQRLEA